MKPFVATCGVSFLLALNASAQTKTVAERLGYPADSKLLIIHADDLAFARSVDAASFGALESGAVSSASVLVPSAQIAEVAAYAKSHPDADLGLHLTLTSECTTHREPIESKDRVQSLLDPTGTLWSQTRLVAAKANPLEAEREIRAQVERALALGIHPTHLDSHMGSLFSTPELFAVYVKVAHDYHLPFLAVRVGDPRARVQPPLSEKDVVLDAVVIAGPEVRPEQWRDFYLMAIKALKPGLTEMIVHLATDDAEMRTIAAGGQEACGSAWRQRDYDVVKSSEFKRALSDNHVILVRWRDLQRLANQP